MKTLWDDVIFDIETDGLLPEHASPPFCMTQIHCLVIKDVPTGHIRHFARDNLFPLTDVDIAELASRGMDAPELLSVGVAVLSNAKRRVIGHNIIDFDLPAIEMCFPQFTTNASVFDTLPMVRMVFADIKDKDFRMAARGTLEGRLIGSHGLEAWGQRLGLMKGDYKKDRTEELKERHKEAGLPVPTKEELHTYVWGTWNVAMHAYMLQDAEVNEVLLIKIEALDWSEDAVQLEHEIHALMVQQERNGFFFDRAKGEALGASLQAEYDRYATDAYEHIGRWYRPPRWHDEESMNVVHGEGPERRTWGNVDIPKRSMNFVKSNAKLNGDYKRMRANTIEGVPICKVELRDFNPNSRPQIVDRLTHLYGWTPQDFTEKGSARVDDTILRELVDHIPLAETLAEIFYYKKRIGMVVDGKNGWLKLCKDDQRIHGRVNVGGTVTGRATHAAPNISQVTGVTPIEIKTNEAKGFTIDMARNKYDSVVERHIREGTYVSAEWNDRKNEGAIYVRGREGNHGWDCRELFTVPEGFKLVGCDLSGIEFRCLGNLTFPFDDGEIIDVVLNGDIHQRNADLAGIGRGTAKRLLYACVDMDTMALTKDGWRHYDDLYVGQSVMSYNADRDVKEWTPIRALHHVKNAKRVRVQGRGIDVVCTPDHRWATFHKRMVFGKYVTEFEFCRTDELTNAHKIIANAPFSETEVPSTDVVDMGAPKYRDDLPSVVMNMNTAERTAWLHGFLTADGHQRTRTNNIWGFTQKPCVTFETALAAMYVVQNNRIGTHDMGTCYKTETLQTRTWGCQKLKIEPIENGDVWCMTTDNSSFVMRRGNFVTITGNCMYGGGDAKLGSIVEPLASEGRQKSLGKDLRGKLMAAMPSLNKAIKAIHMEARRNGNTIAGLDGRRLYIRAKHAALNMRLQSDGALIAKKWCLITDDLFYAAGWTHSIKAEYAFCSWSHDEIQVAVRNEYAEQAAKMMEAAAPLAGEYFKFKCPVAAESKIGNNWAQTH